MKTAVIILGLFVVLVIIAGVSILAAITIRIQQQDDKLTEFELRLNNMTEGSQIVNEQIRQLTNLMNK